MTLMGVNFLTQRTSQKNDSGGMSDSVLPYCIQNRCFLYLLYAYIQGSKNSYRLKKMSRG